MQNLETLGLASISPYEIFDFWHLEKNQMQQGLKFKLFLKNNFFLDRKLFLQSKFWMSGLFFFLTLPKYWDTYSDRLEKETLHHTVVTQY